MDRAPAQGMTGRIEQYGLQLKSGARDDGRGVRGDEDRGDGRNDGRDRCLAPCQEQRGGQPPPGHATRRYDTRRVFRRMKSIRMNCPSVIVFVKYAFPRQMALTFFTNSTRLLSRASMKVLIRIPERRHSATSR